MGHTHLNPGYDGTCHLALLLEARLCGENVVIVDVI